MNLNFLCNDEFISYELRRTQHEKVENENE